MQGSRPGVSRSSPKAAQRGAEGAGLDGDPPGRGTIAHAAQCVAANSRSPPTDSAGEPVLKVDDAAAIDENDAYFAAPFCEEGDLDDVIQKSSIGVRRAVDILLDIASGASFIHGKGFLHRDLKPSNILCDNDGKFVIGDFGSVVKKGINGYAETLSRHSLLYRTPEEIRCRRAYEQGDVYQLGIILFQLLGGALPYNERDWLKSKELSKYQQMPHPDNQIYASGGHRAEDY